MGKRIVYVVGDLSYPNGMSQVLSQKVNYLARNTDYEIFAVLTEKARLPWFYQLDERVHSVNFDLNFDDLYLLPLYKRLWLFMKRQRRYRKLFADYLQEVRPDVTVSVLRREINFINDMKDGSKKVGELHFSRFSYRIFEKRWLPAWFNRWVTRQWQGRLVREIRRLDSFVVLTQEDYASWLPDVQRVRVIPNPVSYFPEESSACQAKQVIAVGRYTWQKGFDMLIQAWAQVHHRHPDWRLRIYGPGEADAFKQQVREQHLEETLFCEGPTKDVYSRYMESSIYVLSSRYEGFGIVLVEAMSAGLPCVSFACPCGPRDIIRDGEDGILVEPNDVQALADRICFLIEHEDVRCQYGVAAKKNVERFKEENIMSLWIDLFESL